MKYAIFYGGREITPPDNIMQIFHGNKLIWERLKATALADTALRGYRFTRKGVLCPHTVTPADTAAKIYDKTGKNVLFSTSFESCFNAQESGILIWDEIPTYRTVSTAESVIAKDTSDYVVLKNNAFEPVYFEPILTDTAAQWKGHSTAIASHLAGYPNRIADGGGGGIAPLKYPLGYTDGWPAGVSNRQTLAYVQDEILNTDKNYAVLSVCGDTMVCADDPYMTNSASAYGTITERKLDGTLIQNLFSSNQRLITYNTNELRRRFYVAGDYVIYNSTHSSKLYLAAKPKSASAATINQDGYQNPYLGQNLPENVFFYNGNYYIIGEIIRYGETPESAKNTLNLPGDDFGGYRVYEPDSPGCYWLDAESGILYVMTVSNETDENGDFDYRVIRIQL